MADNDIQAQLRADPRVKAWIASRYPRGTRGSPEVPADLLRSWGYTIPDGYGVAVQGGAAHVYDKFDKWDVIIPAAAAAGSIYGAANLGATAAGGAGASGSAVPTTINAAGLPVNMSASATAGITPLGGLTAAQAAKWGASGATNAARGDAASDAAPGGLKGFLTDPQTYGGLAGLLATLATRSSGSGAGDMLANNPQLQSLLDMSVNRAQRTDPLHQSITQLAMSRLPANMQRPLSMGGGTAQGAPVSTAMPVQNGTPSRPNGIPSDWELVGNMNGSGDYWAPPGTRT